MAKRVNRKYAQLDGSITQCNGDIKSSTYASSSDDAVVYFITQGRLTQSAEFGRRASEVIRGLPNKTVAERNKLMKAFTTKYKELKSHGLENLICEKPCPQCYMPMILRRKYESDEYFNCTGCRQEYVISRYGLHKEGEIHYAGNYR